MNSVYFIPSVQTKMGNLISPPKDTVVLIPPRISTRGLTRPIVLENPFNVAFGSLFRKEVLEDLHSFDGNVALDVLMCPELPPTLAAHLSLAGSSNDKSVKGGALNLHFNQALSATMSGVARLSISGSDGLSGYGIVTRDMGSDVQLAVTGSVFENMQIFGFRGIWRSLKFGCEIPNRSIPESRAWAIARLSPNISLGLQGTPLKTYTFSACLDKRIENTDSTYSVVASVDYPSRDVTLGYSQHLVTHRRIYNPLEEKHVKYICNYIDLAVEGKTRGETKTPTNSILHEVCGGISWQLNKNLLTKLHASTARGVVLTGVVRNWWVPSVLGSLSIGLDTRGSPYIGGRLQVSNWLSTVEYEKGQPVSELPQTKWISMNEVKRFNSDNYHV